MIPKELEVLRPTRERTLAATHDLDQAQLDFSPGAGKWSVGEILDHVVLVETLLRADIGALIGLATEGKETVLRRSFADLDITIAPLPKALLPWLEIPFKVSAFFTPKPVLEFLARSRWMPFRNPESATPRPRRPAAELRRALRDSCAATEELITDHPDVDYPRLIHRHPLMGANNVPDILRFLVSHEQRHQAQIQDVLRTPGMPAPKEAA